MGEIKKVGIMGGTFDPIHIGHLILAENAYEKYHLDSVLMLSLIHILFDVKKYRL